MRNLIDNFIVSLFIDLGLSLFLWSVQCYSLKFDLSFHSSVNLFVF